MAEREDPTPLPLEVEEFLTWLRLERGRAPSTIDAYRRDLRAWVDHLRPLGRRVTAVVEDDIIDWIHALRDRGESPATVKRRVVAVRSLHRYLAEEDVVAHDVGAEVAPPAVRRGLPKALSEEQVTALLDAVPGSDPVGRRDRAVLETLYGTGVRISELVGLSLGDVDLHDGYLRVLGKGSKERVVPILGTANEAMVEWLSPAGRGALMPTRWRRRDDEEAVFLNQRGGRLGRQGMWLVVKAHGATAGLADVLTPHVLRHSCATYLLDHGADIRAVQELLGHASIGTTQVYTRVSTDRLVQAWRRAHPRATIDPGSER